MAHIEVLLIMEHGRLLRYVQRHLPPDITGDVEPVDVLQDTFWEAFRRIEQFRVQDSTSAYRWLVTIARHRLAELLRSRRAAKRGGGSYHEAQGDSIVAMLSELAVNERTPSRSAAMHEMKLAVERALERMPKSVRAALRMRYIDGMSPPQIAVLLDKSEVAVRQLCHRGLGLMRKELRSASLFI